MQYPPFPLKVSISPQRSWPRLLLAAFVAVVFIAVAVIVETSERARGLGDFGVAVYVIRGSCILRFQSVLIGSKNRLEPIRTD